MFPYPKVVPQLVEDTNLKRARTEVNGDEAIRVVTSGTGTFTIDPQEFADGTGLAPAQTDVGSVNSHLTTLVSNSTTNTTNTGSLVTTTGTINTTLGTINSTQGSVSDAAWSGTGDATVISLLKGIVNKLQ